MTKRLFNWRHKPTHELGSTRVADESLDEENFVAATALMGHREYKKALQERQRQRIHATLEKPSPNLLPNIYA
jgi:hypothetical protein